jgi:hypothetical protein
VPRIDHPEFADFSDRVEMSRLSVRLPDFQREALRDLAADLDLSEARLVREAVWMLIAAFETNNPPLPFAKAR